MNVGTRQILQLAEQAQKRIPSNGDRRANMPPSGIEVHANGGAAIGRKPRVFVAAENR